MKLCARPWQLAHKIQKEPFGNRNQFGVDAGRPERHGWQFDDVNVAFRQSRVKFKTEYLFAASAWRGFRFDPPPGQFLRTCCVASQR